MASIDGKIAHFSKAWFQPNVILIIWPFGWLHKNVFFLPNLFLYYILWKHCLLIFPPKIHLRLSFQFSTFLIKQKQQQQQIQNICLSLLLLLNISEVMKTILWNIWNFSSLGFVLGEGLSEADSVSFFWQTTGAG